MPTIVKTKMWTRWLTAILCALALQGMVSVAGEEPIVPPPVPLPPDPNLPVTDKPVTTNALDVDFGFDDNGRRDPFTFTKNVAIVEQNGDKPPVEGSDEPPTIAPEVVKRIKSAAEADCAMAEASLMELDPNAAITKCDAGMDEFKPIPNLSAFPELEIVKGRLLRARKASEQMRARQTAQRDFDAMNIEISGVMALKKNSQAIINGEISHKGTMVKASSDSADVMVDEILPERVTFVFRGYRMMLLLSEASRKK